MKKIPLTQGKFALVDEQDYKELMRHKWCAARSYGDKWYAVCSKLKVRRGMHNQILGDFPPDKPMIDHLNGDGLDNRRANLRFCTNRQNQHNVGAQKRSKSGYRGVTWSNNKNYKNPWYVCIRINGKNKYVGRASSPKEGAQLYAQALANADLGS